MGVVDCFGNIAAPIQFEGMSQQYSEGLVQAKMHGKWGYIDLHGKWVIEPTFDRASEFMHGLATVVRDGRICIIGPSNSVSRESPISK